MSPVLLSFADGTIFFIGLFVCVLSEVFLLVTNLRWARMILRLFAIIGILFVLISATPLPFILYCIWFLYVAIGLVHFNTRLSSKRKLIGLGLLLVNLVLGLLEWSYRRAPEVSISRGTTVYVLGDSISEGMGKRYTYWPERLGQEISCPVVNLALAGATVETALKQAKGISKLQSLVIVEIGGNDLLGNTGAEDFQKSLDELIASLVPEHQVLMFELPLYPFRNQFGKAQREVVKKYGIHMLPKRIFADILGTKNATVDGLHLSQIGHDRAATILSEIISVRLDASQN